MHNQQVGGRNVTRITSCLLYADRQDRQCNTKYHQTLILFSREGIDEWQAHKKKKVKNPSSFTDWFFDCFGPSPFISMWASPWRNKHRTKVNVEAIARHWVFQKTCVLRIFHRHAIPRHSFIVKQTVERLTMWRLLPQLPDASQQPIIGVYCISQKLLFNIRPFFRLLLQVETAAVTTV